MNETKNSKKIPPSDISAEKTASNVISQQWQSISVPLHHPEILKKFAELNPDYPERILIMVETEQKHKHALEKEELQQNANSISKIFFERCLGQIFAFIIAIIGLFAGLFSILKGYSISGTILSGGTILSLVYTFIQSSRKHQ